MWLYIKIFIIWAIRDQEITHKIFLNLINHNLNQVWLQNKNLNKLYNLYILPFLRLKVKKLKDVQCILIPQKDVENANKFYQR